MVQVLTVDIVEPLVGWSIYVRCFESVNCEGDLVTSF